MERWVEKEVKLREVGEVTAIWGWLASALELSGLWLVGSKKKVGFLITIIGNLIWIYVAIAGLPATGVLLVVVPAVVINVRNFLKWRREEMGPRDGG